MKENKLIDLLAGDKMVPANEESGAVAFDPLVWRFSVFNVKVIR